MIKSNRKTRLAYALLLNLCLFSFPAYSKTIFNPEIAKIAKSINKVNPFLTSAKKAEFALGIFRAAKKYQLDPNLLVAITHQETAFRENLPEGKAGEIGICQIRKMWIKQPKFREEFKTAKIKDLSSAEKSFAFAAWILSDLKKSVKKHTIPFWSYYNAVSFKPRLRYFVSVNRHLAAIRNGKVDLNEGYYETPWMPERRIGELTKLPPLQNRNIAVLSYQRSVKVAQNTTPTQNSSSGWIPPALRKLRGNIQTASLPSLTRAAIELNIPNLFGSLPLQD